MSDDNKLQAENVLFEAMLSKNDIADMPLSQVFVCSPNFQNYSLNTAIFSFYFFVTFFCLM